MRVSKGHFMVCFLNNVKSLTNWLLSVQARIWNSFCSSVQKIIETESEAQIFFLIAELRSAIPWNTNVTKIKSQFSKMLTLSYPVEFTILFLNN